MSTPAVKIGDKLLINEKPHMLVSTFDSLLLVNEEGTTFSGTFSYPMHLEQQSILDQIENDTPHDQQVPVVKFL